MGRVFHLRREEWEFLVKSPEGGFPHWISGALFFALLEATAREMEGSPPEIQAIEPGRVFDDLTPALTRAGLRLQFRVSRDLSGREWVDTLIDDVIRMLAPGGKMSRLPAG